MEKILVLGGGVAGCSISYFLKNKGYDVSIIEKLPGVGGLSRTYHYGGHPYEFGPHVWFWPGGIENEVNNVIHTLSDGNLHYINRKLFTYIEREDKKYRYPIHFSEVANMDSGDELMVELGQNRDAENKLKTEVMPIIGECSFEEYFKSAIGSGLYSRFMENYTWKMWNIPGNELTTRMVWADRFNHTYSGKEQGGLKGYDPIKFEDHTLGKGISFQVYPHGGWNVIWERMIEGCKLIKDKVLQLKEINGNTIILTESGDKYSFSDYKYVINTLDIDELWGEDTLPYTGRMMLPFVIPNVEYAFPEGAESIHYSSAEFMTRITEMKTITKHSSDSTLLLIEVPILPGAEKFFPENTITYAMKNNLFARKAYPQQSLEAINQYEKYVLRGKHINNLLHCGRHAQFRYWGMPETVNSALQLAKTL